MIRSGEESLKKAIEEFATTEKPIEKEMKSEL